MNTDTVTLRIHNRGIVNAKRVDFNENRDWIEMNSFLALFISFFNQLSFIKKLLLNSI